MDTRGNILQLIVSTLLFAFALPFLGLAQYTGGWASALGFGALMSLVLLTVHAGLNRFVNDLFTDAIMGVKKHKNEDALFWLSLVAMFFAPGAILFGASFFLPVAVFGGVLGLIGASALVSVPLIGLFYLW